MSQYPTPNQPYFTGINYNPSFFTNQSGISLTYATNNYLQRVGTNPTSIAINTTFTGGLNASYLTTTTDSSIGGNLSVTKALTTTYITSNIALTESSPLISLNGSVVVNNNTGVYKFFNMNCPINQVFSTI